MEMRELPESEIYELGLKYWPYKKSLEETLGYIRENAPKGGTLLDMMCGPGFLLNEIYKERSDLSLSGVDIDPRYITYGQKKYPAITFQEGDVLTWKTDKLFDVVICTGSLHHIPYEQQEQAVSQMVSMVKPDGSILIADVYIDDYADEVERKLSASKLGYEYLKETIQNSGSDPIVDFTIDILWNDVFMKEYKTSIQKRAPIFNKYFNEIHRIKTWPNFKSQYGDYISIFRKR